MQNKWHLTRISLKNEISPKISRKKSFIFYLLKAFIPWNFLSLNSTHFRRNFSIILPVHKAIPKMFQSYQHNLYHTDNAIHLDDKGPLFNFKGQQYSIPLAFPSQHWALLATFLSLDVHNEMKNCEARDVRECAITWRNSISRCNYRTPPEITPNSAAFVQMWPPTSHANRFAINEPFSPSRDFHFWLNQQKSANDFSAELKWFLIWSI